MGARDTGARRAHGWDSFEKARKAKRRLFGGAVFIVLCSCGSVFQNNHSPTACTIGDQTNRNDLLRAAGRRLPSLGIHAFAFSHGDDLRAEIGLR